MSRHDRPDSATEAFLAHRNLLFTVAYEMLGSAADAEDVLQETWLRWASVDTRGDPMAQTRKTSFPSRRPATSGRTARIIDITAIAATSAFAGGALLTQTVIVPHWRAMDPAAFLLQFAIDGPASGATVFPFEAASVVLLGVTTYSTIKGHRPGRLAWALATAAMIGTFLLLIYFVPANIAMLDPAFPAQTVPAELTTWYRWNWVRTGLGLASAALAWIALTARRGENATTPT